MIELGILAPSGMVGRSAIMHQAYLDKVGKDYTRSLRVFGHKSSGRELGEVFAEKEGALKKAYPFWVANGCPLTRECYRCLVFLDRSHYSNYIRISGDGGWKQHKSDHSGYS
ncbi:hypothetical protein J4217_00265 [Candidatus Pacearchaeota archaeon]|nr:hypothetical protein [Candidatus Pacearchaeota archaeon]